jgi:hypothetical protein
VTVEPTPDDANLVRLTADTETLTRAADLVPEAFSRLGDTDEREPW